MSTTHKTKALILRAIPYGDTSLMVTALTELFGLQTYLVKGVRTSGKSKVNKAVFFQPAAILDMVVYHHPTKTINFVKEYEWAIIYKNMYSNVVKNSVALYVIELLTKCLKQPDDNPALYYFAEDVCIAIDNCEPATLANIPLFTAIHLPSILGLQIADDYTTTQNILDLKDGCFISTLPLHTHYVQEPYSKLMSIFLKTLQPREAAQVLLNTTQRKVVLEAMEQFYQLHISEFGKMKSLPVLQAVFS